MIADIFVVVLMVSGSAFMLLASVGMVRFPDLFTRMQAATKAGTLGAGCVLAAVAVHQAELAVTANAVLIIVFLILTAPTAAHRLARAAYRMGAPLWAGTHTDELRDALRRGKGEDGETR